MTVVQRVQSFGTLDGLFIVIKLNQDTLPDLGYTEFVLAFIFKNYGIRDVMQFLEVYGLPILGLWMVLFIVIKAKSGSLPVWVTPEFCAGRLSLRIMAFVM